MTDDNWKTDVYECSYCTGDVVWDDEKLAFVHATDGDRLSVGVAGDYVSAAHNRAGTRVNSADVIDKDENKEN